MGNKTLGVPEIEKLTSYIEATKNHPDRSIGCCAILCRIFWCFWNLVFLALGILTIIGAVWVLLQYRLDRIADPLSVTTVRLKSSKLLVFSQVSCLIPEIEPLFFGIVVGAFITVVSFQGNLIKFSKFNKDSQGAFGYFRANKIMIMIYAWTLNATFLIVFGIAVCGWLFVKGMLFATNLIN